MSFVSILYSGLHFDFSTDLFFIILDGIVQIKMINIKILSSIYWAELYALHQEPTGLMEPQTNRWF